MISQATRVEAVIESSPVMARAQISELLSKGIFGLVVALIVFTAIPYGTAEPWWKGFFVCCALAIAILWIIDGAFTSWTTGGERILFPVVVLAAFAWLQAVPFPFLNSVVRGGSGNLDNTISADPEATRFFFLQLVGLIVTGALLFRYSATERRQKVLIHIIISLAVVSAIFGILRQTMQHQVGFGLPLLSPELGYGQFVNKNHFAFLMEMALGLTLGIILAGGAKRERVLLYLGALLPIWMALVLSNSRGGLIAMLAQVVSAGLLITLTLHTRDFRHDQSHFMVVLGSLPARIGMIIVLIIGVLWGTLWLGGDRLVNRIAEGQEGPAASQIREGASRNEMWRATWRMFAANPIAGVGMGAYWVAIPTFHNASGMITPQEAHNDYLELLASGGVIGFALGVWFLVVVIGRIKVNLQRTHGFSRAAVFGAILGLIGVAVHSLVDFGLHMLVNAVVFVVLIVIATRKHDPLNHAKALKSELVVGSGYLVDRFRSTL